MKEISKNRLVLASCVAMAMSFAACSNDSDVTEDPCAKCTADQTCEDGVCVNKPVDDPCAKCTADQTCEDGVCVDKPVDDPCAKCTADQTCEDGVCVDKPVVDPCEACTEDQQCVEGVCQDLCGGQLCTGNEICNLDTQQCEEPVDPCAACTDKQECINLECVDIDPCANKTCPDNQKCDREQGGACVDIDPCETVNCPGDQTCIKARCVDNACLVDGVEKDCGDGKTCDKGECVDDGCQDKTCDEGWQCIKGICEETACLDKFCDEGRSCKGGTCVDNECLDMTCDEGMICSKGNCTYEACLDKDPCVSGKACNEEGVCEFIVAPALIIDETEDVESDEAGDTVALTVHLNNAPTQEVRIACEVVTESPNKEVDVACDDIVFNSENWQIGQTILVTGVEDYVKDGDQKYSIKASSVSEDADFNALSAQSVELTNIDKTTPGFTFSATSLTTYEDQTQEAATFTVALNSKPTATVSLAAMSSNAKEGTVTPTTIRFTMDNWNEPQTITVKGVDDDVRDGNVNYTVFFSPSESNDEDYQGIQPKSIKVTNIDNDVAGLNVNIPAEDYVVLEGQESKIIVKLNTRPKQDVSIKVSVDDATEAELDTKEIVLTPDNWNTGVEITLSGVPDYEIDGDQPIKISFDVVSEDEDYHFADPVVYDGTVKDADIAGIVPAMGDSPIVKEGSSDFVTMSLSLTSKPKSKVTVNVVVTDETELKVNKKTLTFSPDFWNVPMDLLVNSVDDQIVDGDIKSKVVMTMSSSDKNFDGLVREVEFTTVDNDVAGIVVNSNAASFPENSAATASMTVVLLAEPTADVTVAVSSSDVTELSVTSGNSLTFTKDNWNKPQTVNIKVMDDNIADGTQTAWVNFSGSSADKNFNGITAKSAEYKIIDNEAASIVLTTDVTTIAQASPSAVASVRLGVQPSGNVTVTLASSDDKIIQFEKPSVSFTTSDWDQPKNVNITADFSAVASASATVTISGTGSGDAIYSGIVSNKVNLNLVKVEEVQNFAYTGKVQTVDLPKGKYKLEVWGAQGGYNKQTDYPGGKGGYSVGTIALANTTKLYIYVGGEGSSSYTVGQKLDGGFNGGGFALAHNWGRGSGGGASDIRVGSDSLYSRVVVAGGGGGNTGTTTAMTVANLGGHGGGSQGGVSPSMIGGVAGAVYYGNGGTQTAGGTNEANASLNGSFGKGGDSTSSEAGGGGGWYGGAAGNSAGGGSGYIYTSSTYTNYPQGCVLNSTHYLLNAQTIAGNVGFPAPIGGTETGHPGNGYARITLVTE